METTVRNELQHGSEKNYILGGQAILTAHSLKTDKHYTYKIKATDETKTAFLVSKNKIKNNIKVKKKVINYNPLSKEVKQLTINEEIVNTFESAAEAERKTGISRSHITACCLHRKGRKTAGGYIWKYKE